MHADADVVAPALGVALGVRAAVAAALVAVREAGGCPVVPGGDDALVGDQHRAHVPPQAVGALARGHRQQHEVLLAGGASGRPTQVGRRGGIAQSST